MQFSLSYVRWQTHSEARHIAILALAVLAVMALVVMPLISRIGMFL